MESFKPKKEKMNSFESEQKLTEKLIEILEDSEKADGFIFEIGSSVADRYELPLEELGKIYELVNQSLEDEAIDPKKIVGYLVENIGIRDEELAEVAAILEDILNRIKKAEK